LLHDRQGFIIALTDHQSRTGYGEIAPLPGLDQTSLDQCRSDLSALRKPFVNSLFNTDHFSLTVRGLGMMVLPVAVTPHTLFGLESALLSLYLQNTPASLPDLIKIPVNGLFIPDINDDQSDTQIQTLKFSGIKTIKVKIGRLPADQEINQILRLADIIGKDLRLRLDGNQSLSSATYCRYFSALGHLNIEYAEEPLREDALITSQNVPWMIALDESLPQYLDGTHPDLAKLPSYIRTVILKPGLLDGLSGMASLIAEARQRNIQTVLSSAFNTSISLTTLCLFSRLSGLSSDTACGFDTLRYLQSDVLMQSPAISDGALTIPKSLLGDMQLNFNVITREDL
jgi:o-succinylbenzoate synthase